MFIVAALMFPAHATESCGDGTCTNPDGKNIADQTNLMQINRALNLGKDVAVADVTSLLQNQVVFEAGTHRAKFATRKSEEIASNADAGQGLEATQVVREKASPAAGKWKSTLAGKDTWLAAAIAYLDQHVKTEGIWRTNGNKEAAGALKKMWDEGGTSVPPGTPSDVVTLAISKKVSEDPPFNVFLAKALSKLHHTRWADSIHAASMLMNLPTGMSPQKQADLKLLLHHFHLVLENEASNRMNMETLTTCTAVFLTPQETLGTVFGPTSHFKENLGLMIEHPDEVGKEQ